MKGRNNERTKQRTYFKETRKKSMGIKKPEANKLKSVVQMNIYLSLSKFLKVLTFFTLIITLLLAGSIIRSKVQSSHRKFVCNPLIVTLYTSFVHFCYLSFIFLVP